MKCVKSVKLLSVKVLNQLNQECYTGILTMVWVLISFNIALQYNKFIIYCL